MKVQVLMSFIAVTTLTACPDDHKRTTGAAADCSEPFHACGGDLVGTWEFAGFCGGDPFAAFCSESKTTYHGNSTYTFRSDKTYSETSPDSVTITFPASCFSGNTATCEQLGQTLGSNSTCTGSASTTCTCTLQLGGVSADGTYSISGESVALSYAAGGASSNPLSYNYCVQGTTLKLSLAGVSSPISLVYSQTSK
jgi:hypothetical protein